MTKTVPYTHNTMNVVLYNDVWAFLIYEILEKLFLSNLELYQHTICRKLSIELVVVLNCYIYKESYSICKIMKRNSCNIIHNKKPRKTKEFLLTTILHRSFGIFYL